MERVSKRPDQEGFGRKGHPVPNWGRGLGRAGTPFLPASDQTGVDCSPRGRGKRRRRSWGRRGRRRGSLGGGTKGAGQGVWSLSALWL